MEAPPYNPQECPVRKSACRVFYLSVLVSGNSPRNANARFAYVRARSAIFIEKLYLIANCPAVSSGCISAMMTNIRKSESIESIRDASAGSPSMRTITACFKFLRGNIEAGFATSAALTRIRRFTSGSLFLLLDGCKSEILFFLESVSDFIFEVLVC